MNTLVELRGVAKAFRLHARDGLRIEVLENARLEVRRGECVALAGPSGCGKSTLLRLIYGNYLWQAGEVLVRCDDEWIDIGAAAPREILELRRWTLGYVSQFLRVIPRVPALEIVIEPLVRRGAVRADAARLAGRMLDRLRIPRRLWDLSPATFSGGEQQRINIARVFAANYPILLLDEPTAALDGANRDTVIELIADAKRRGAGLLGIFHDDEVRAATADRFVDVGAFRRNNAR